MFDSLRALLTEIVDYAGLFPPAALALDPAIRNYAGYRSAPEAWMLGRFICPAAKLADLAGYRDDLFGQNPPFRFSVLGRGGETTNAFHDNLAVDVRASAAFQEQHGGRVRVEAFEVKLPAELLRDECTADLVRLLERTRAQFAEAGLGHVSLACEPVLSGKDARRTAAAAIGGLAFFNTKLALERRGTPADRVMLKLRCGGVEAAAFPSIELVAGVIADCRDSRLPLKFTAGLHHPIRRFDAGVNTQTHGFLNVFIATMLAAQHELREAEIAAILADDDATNFVFTEDVVAWRGRALGADDVVELRSAAATSFGSCSFDEPRDDLRHLTLLRSN